MNIKDFLVYSGTSLRDALKQIDRNHKGIILVCNKNDEIKGLSTDGDIRRYILGGGNINDNICLCLNENFKSVEKNISHEEVYKILDDNIKMIPVIDKNNILIDVITKKNIPERGQKSFYSRAKSPIRISFSGGGSDTTSFFKLLTFL